MDVFSLKIPESPPACPQGLFFPQKSRFRHQRARRGFFFLKKTRFRHQRPRRGFFFPQKTHFFRGRRRRRRRRRRKNFPAQPDPIPSRRDNISRSGPAPHSDKIREHVHMHVYNVANVMSAVPAPIYMEKHGENRWTILSTGNCFTLSTNIKIFGTS